MMKLIFRYVVALTIATVVYAQSDTRPQFEVASVKANEPTDAQASYMPTLDVRPGGRCGSATADSMRSSWLHTAFREVRLSARAG